MPQSLGPVLLHQGRLLQQVRLRSSLADCLQHSKSGVGDEEAER